MVVGHTFSDKPVQTDQVSLSLARGVAIKAIHAVSWVPQFVIHNDNSGPYLPLTQKGGPSYALDQAYAAVPLLPTDVFLTGEEALEFTLSLWQDVLEETTASMKDEEVVSFADQFVTRLLLLDKRKIRAWAAMTDAVASEVRQHLRLGDLPRRVWVLELHLGQLYGAHAQGNTASLVGFILLDSTGDAAATAMLMVYLNLPAFTSNTHGSLLIATENELKAVQISATPPVLPFRDLGT